MAFLTNLIFSLSFQAAQIGYPAYQIYQGIKTQKLDKIWVIYFLLLAVVTILEGTILYPIVYIFGLICSKIWPTLKSLFCFWAYYETYRGALLIEQKGGKYIDLAAAKALPIAGKILPLLGFPKRDAQKPLSDSDIAVEPSESKKTQ